MITARTHSSRLLSCLVTMALLSACASSPHGRTRIATPKPIVDVYSDADMRLQLATTPSIKTPCSADECEANRAFDQQVKHLGEHIANAAYDAHPDLIHRIPNFEFEVADKAEPGITSNASGRIVVLRGVESLGLNETAMTFVLAREMGHIIAEHHQENTATKILLSVAATLLFPALNLFGNTATLAQATSATTATTTMATTAASTATSYVGSKLLLNNVHPDQISEADLIGLDLMARMGLSLHAVARALEDSPEFEDSSDWAQDFRLSVTHVKALDAQSPAPEDETPEPDLPPLMENVAEDPVDIPANAETPASTDLPPQQISVNTNEYATTPDASRATVDTLISAGTSARAQAEKHGENPALPLRHGTSNSTRSRITSSSKPRHRTMPAGPEARAGAHGTKIVAGKESAAKKGVKPVPAARKPAGSSRDHAVRPPKQSGQSRRAKKTGGQS